MKILVNLGGEYSKWLKRSRILGLAIKPVLEALVMIDQIFLRRHHVPPIYSGHIRYREEPEDGIEEFAALPVMLARGWGDCDDISPARVAELRMKGERAKIRIQWRRTRKGKLFHVVVRREDGSIEDPSKILGMGG